MALPIRLKNGMTFYVESEPAPPPEQGPAAPTLADEDLVPKGLAMRGATLAPLPEKEFSEAVQVVEGIAEELTDRLIRDENRMRLSQLELEVKVGFDAKGNVFIATAQASASLKLNLKWELRKPAG